MRRGHLGSQDLAWSVVLSHGGGESEGVSDEESFRAGMRRLRVTMPVPVRRVDLLEFPVVAVPTRIPTRTTVSTSETQCTACQTDIDLSSEEAIQTPCTHVYHIQCLLMLVKVALESTPTLPPRCCGRAIPTPLFQRHLTPALKKALAVREAEQNTPRRVYCANPRCSRFLGERDKTIPVRIYPCPSASCRTRTCARCKAAVPGNTAPEAHTCSHEASHNAVLRLGSRLGWARCPNCEELIERHGGCAHMTCVCGSEFCYNCSRPYQNCNCHEQGPLLEEVPGHPRRAGQGAQGRPRDRDLFAPLHRGEDLRPRLQLWIPPTLNARLTPPREEEEAPRRRRRNTAASWANEDLAQEAPAPPVPTPATETIQQAPALPPAPESPVLSILSIQDGSTQEHIGSCMMLGGIEESIFIKGVRAQQSRRSLHRRANSV
ncbi:hypothetical protein GY45DRAFT_1377318 [Cubamyces sp. BRFM 1775]|nr:hypothetical protein GY45DRAFT_1377318 [Cubamyces sp. BRFM 1775]